MNVFPKTIILSMFCNDREYKLEKESIVQTWHQTALNHGYTHIFYTSDENAVEPYLVNDVLYLPCKDDLKSTYDKTIKAIEYIVKNYQFDILVKTNVSTFVNINILDKLISYIDKTNNTDLIYCNRLLLARYGFFCRGDFTVFNKKYCKDFLDHYTETLDIFDNRILDDVGMFYLLYRKYGKQFCNNLKTIPHIVASEYDYNKCKNICAVRLKTDKKIKGSVIARRMNSFNNAILSEKQKFKFDPIFQEYLVLNKAMEQGWKNKTCKLKFNYAKKQFLNDKFFGKPLCAKYGRIAVYTCITGGYDKLKPIPEKLQRNIFDFICFTDKKIKNTNGWKILPIPDELKTLSNVKQQRLIKICPYKYLSDKYKASIWIDGSLQIIKSLYDLFYSCDFNKFSLFTRKHPVRDCIYDEAETCIQEKKDSAEIVEKQINKLKRENYPAHNGLAETNVIIRFHDEQCKRICDKWSEILITGSHRDQLSFNYACWLQKLEYGIIPHLENLFSCRYFKYVKHGK